MYGCNKGNFTSSNYPAVHLPISIHPSLRFSSLSRNRHRSMHAISLAGRALIFREAGWIRRFGISRFLTIALERTYWSPAVICAMIGAAIRLIGLTPISRHVGSFSASAPGRLRGSRGFPGDADKAFQLDKSKVQEICERPQVGYFWIVEG